MPSDEVFLTAPQNGLSIGGSNALQIRLHPTIDLAVILRPGLQIKGNEIEPFDVLDGSPKFGEDVWAFGFPADPLGAGRHDPRERLFKGHIQRLLVSHRGLLGSTYKAAELSFSSPAGLSGGPIFRPAPPWDLLGVVTENIESKTFLEESEEVISDRGRETTLYQRVVSYGVAASFGDASEWLQAMIPEPRAGADPNATIIGESLPES